jgi:hypothetical protein
LTNDGIIYLVRGPAILPQLLQTNAAPVLSSPGSVQHGTGNLVLNLSGANLLPGVAITWNGAYRTTNWVDATHVSIDIAAEDLVSPGTASLVATNPGSPSSPIVIVTIN